MKFSTTGAYVGQITFAKHPSLYPTALAIDAAGRIYCANYDYYHANNDCIYVIAPNGMLLGKLPIPEYLHKDWLIDQVAVDKAGGIYTVFGKHNTLMRFDPLPNLPR